jgi:hypothetical protein
MPETPLPKRFQLGDRVGLDSLTLMIDAPADISSIPRKSPDSPRGSVRKSTTVPAPSRRPAATVRLAIAGPTP